MDVGFTTDAVKERVGATATLGMESGVTESSSGAETLSSAAPVGGNSRGESRSTKASKPKRPPRERLMDDAPMPAEVVGKAGWRHVVPELVVSSLVLNVLALALPLGLLQMYDRIIPNQSVSTLTLLVGGVAAAVTLEALMKYLRGSITSWLGARFEHQVGVTALRHLSGIPIQSFRSIEPGIHAERLSSVARVRDFYSGDTLAIFLDLPFVGIFLAVIGVIGGWLVMVPMIMLLLFVLVLLQYGRVLRKKVAERAVLDDRRFNFLAETIGGIHSVKTMSMESLMYRRYERLEEAGVEKGAELAQATAVAGNMGALFTQLMTVGVVGAGTLIVLQGDMTPGGLAACILLSVRSLQPLRRSLATWMRYQNVGIARDRLRKLFWEKSENIDSLPPLPPITGTLELHNVCLRHPGMEQDMLHDVSLTVQRGECIAIRGGSGSGKSSLLTLLNGASIPTKGEVLVDGARLASFDPDSLHTRIAYLPQQGELVTGTILENITMFQPDLNARATEVARAVGLDGLVAHMRLGYETVVGDGITETMPGGIRQRIAIARALVTDPDVLLFDEANINLDLDGDNILRIYMEAQKGKRTIVLVTHRPSLLKLADRVLSLDGGRLLDDGGAAGRDDGDVTVEAVSVERPEVAERGVTDAVGYFRQASDLSVCLPALLTAVGWHGAPREMAEAMPHMVDNLDLSGLRNVMVNLGFRSSSYPTRLDQVDPRLLPCLFVPQGSGAKVIVSSEKGVLTAFDSDTLTVERIENPSSERGEALVFSSEDLDVKQREQKRFSHRLFGRFKGLLVFVFILSVISAVLALSPPLFVMGVFNSVLPTADLELEVLLIAGVLIAIMLDWTLRKLKAGILGHVAARTEYILGNSVFQRILGLPAQSIERVSVGEQVARIRDLEALRDFFLGPLSLLIYDLPAIVIYVLLLGIMNPTMLIVIVAAAALYTLLGAISYGPQRQSQARASRLTAERSKFLSETLSKLPTLRIAGASHKWLERFRDLSGRATYAEWRSRRIGERIASVAGLIGVFTAVGALTVTVLGAMSGAGSAGAVMATMMIIWRLTGPLHNGFMSIGTLVRVASSMRQIDNLMKLKVERDASTRQTIRPESYGSVTFSRVSFRYSMDSDPALLGVTFSVEPGQVVAIAGSNGSGKSTLLKLLVRTYSPQAGSIRIDNVDIRQLTPADLRAQISYMPQRCEIFYGTVAQNLRLVEPTASDEELEWAAQMAGLLDDILALPEGWSTRISDTRADQLPNGFRQRLSLARAYLRTAPIMLLDEPGNGLDDASDRAFMQAVQGLRGRSTVFIVSHRPSHMRLADVCIYLDRGGIRAMGPFEDIKKTIFSGIK